MTSFPVRHVDICLDHLSVPEEVMNEVEVAVVVQCGLTGKL